MAKATKSLVEDVDAPEPETKVSATELAAAFAKALRQANDDAGPIRQMPLAKVRITPPWHPSGDPNRPELARATYLNGHRMREAMLSNAEIELFNQLKPGKYHGRRWTVISKDDSEGAAIYVYLPNKEQSDRLALKEAGKNLEALLRLMVEEVPA